MKVLSKFVFFLKTFLSNKCMIIYILKEKPLPYQKGGDFINGHCIIFEFSFVW
jgi:hypothetical protein